MDLALALPTRLEPINGKHPDTVALVRGPLVLFAIGDGPATSTSQQLLAVQRVPQQTAFTAGARQFRAFGAINDETYTTYLKVT